MGQYDRAVDSELRCIRRDPANFWAHVVLGWAYQQKAMHPEATAELQQAVKLTGGFSFALAALGQELAASGDVRGAETVLAQLQQRRATTYVSAYDIALIYAALKERDSAFRWLGTAIDERASFLPLITWDRRADLLRRDARFAGVVGRLGLPAH